MDNRQPVKGQKKDNSQLKDSLEKFRDNRITVKGQQEKIDGQLKEI